MKIAIITAGGRGDVQPYIALGSGLRMAGHNVLMPAAEEFRDIIKENGMEYIQTNSVNPQEFLRSLEMKEAAKSKNKLIFLNKMFKALAPMMEGIFNETWEACQGCDLIITTMGPMGAYDSAEKLGIPCIHTLLIPACPTSGFQSPFAPGFFNIGIYNKISHKLLEQIVWQPFRAINNRWRKNVLGLKSCDFWGIYDKVYGGEVPVIAGFSPSIIPGQNDWPESVRISGYWFLDQPENWQPPEELNAFLKAGPPPVYIGFGSMVDKEPERITKIVIEALRLSGQRGILSAGWNGLGGEELPDTVYKVGSIPHSWLFKRMAAIVHHGGAGTTAAALRSGIPQIVTPFFCDQPFWGQRIFELGVGPKAVPYSRLTPEKLAGLINAAVNNKEIKAGAKALGEKIDSENGVKKAVDIIQEYLTKNKYN
ncbi:MAG: glycosyl transferase, UDP-glucuronosyltransferase [Eubacterium sp.]|nr:glycosyl transferase, UDP-glucuronosyltransferase [Eubacterium sp.]